MASGHILKEVKDGIATVTLNRPEKLNAFSGTMAAELYASFAEYDKDDDVRVIVVTGAGRAFSAGADFRAAAIPSTPTRAPSVASGRRRRFGRGTCANQSSRQSMGRRSGWESRCRCNGTSGSRPKRANRLRVRAAWRYSGSAQPVDRAADDRPGEGQRTADDRTDYHRA